MHLFDLLLAGLRSLLLLIKKYEKVDLFSLIFKLATGDLSQHTIVVSGRRFCLFGWRSFH